MKSIKPIKVLFKGVFVDVDLLHIKSVSDNLEDQVCFEWNVYINQDESVGGGFVRLDGIEQYKTWDASAAGAYKIVADSVGLELVENSNVWSSQ